MSPLLLEAAARRPQETDLPDMSPLLLDVACRSLQLMSWHEMSPLLPAVRRRVPFTCRPSFTRMSPELEADKLPTGRALTLHFLYPFGFCGVFWAFHAYDQCPVGIHLHTDVRQDGLARTDFHGRFIVRWDINHIDRRRG